MLNMLLSEEEITILFCSSPLFLQNNRSEGVEDDGTKIFVAYVEYAPFEGRNNHTLFCSSPIFYETKDTKV